MSKIKEYKISQKLTIVYFPINGTIIIEIDIDSDNKITKIYGTIINT